MDFQSRYGSSSKFRINNSKLQLVLRCGLAFRNAEERTHRAATPAQVIGTSIAAAAELDNRTKMASTPRPSLAELVEAGVARFEQELAECEVDATKFELDHAKDAAASGSRAYGELLSPKIKGVLLAEEVVIAEIAPGIELAGTLDCVTEGVVRDTKSGRRWTQERADASRQLSAYSLLHEGRFGKLPDRVAIDSLYQQRGAWKAETLWSRRTERELSAFVETAERAKQAIEAGIFLPAAEGAWWCSCTWCPDWKKCTARPGA